MVFYVILDDSFFKFIGYITFLIFFIFYRLYMNRGWPNEYLKKLFIYWINCQPNNTTPHGHRRLSCYFIILNSVYVGLYSVFNKVMINWNFPSLSQVGLMIAIWHSNFLFQYSLFSYKKFKHSASPQYIIPFNPLERPFLQVNLLRLGGLVMFSHIIIKKVYCMVVTI